MSGEKEHVHKLLHIQFKNNKKATEAARIVNSALGQNVISPRSAQNWFKEFREGRLTPSRKKGSGRPPTINKQTLAQRLHHNPEASSRKLAEGHCSKSTALRWLKKSGRKPKKCQFVPHRLTTQQKENRVEASRKLLNIYRRGYFYPRLITCDESWILYDNKTRKAVWRRADEASYRVPKPNLHQRKLMLCIFWNRDGPIHWEFLQTGVSINSDLYCKQLTAVDLAVQARRGQGLFKGKVLFHQDNARPHTSQQTLNHIRNTLNWELLPHPPYSPDLAPSDYHLFRSLKNFLRDREFLNDDEVQQAVEQYLASKMGTNFYERGIQKLPIRWRMVVNNGGDYI